MIRYELVHEQCVRSIGSRQRAAKGGSGKAAVSRFFWLRSHGLWVVSFVGSSCDGKWLVPTKRLLAFDRVGWYALSVALFSNVWAIAAWYLRDSGAARDPRAIRPVIDVIPPIVVGGLLTAAMILRGHYEYLFGIWMCLFALTNMATRMVLPKQIWIVGLFYLAAGTVCLASPNPNFLNPWPMGIVFFSGEMIGGLVLHNDGTRYVAQSVPATRTEEPNDTTT